MNVVWRVKSVLILGLPMDPREIEIAKSVGNIANCNESMSKPICDPLIHERHLTNLLNLLKI